MQDERWETEEQYKRIKALVASAKVDTAPTPGTESEFSVLVNGTKVGKVLKLTPAPTVDGKKRPWVATHGYFSNAERKTATSKQAIREVLLSHMAGCVTGRTPGYNFLADCLNLVALLGSNDDREAMCAKIAGVIPHANANTKVYKDNVVVIVESQDSNALLVRKVQNGNPVICRSQDGDIYRWHGEWSDLRDHVATVLAKSRETERKFLVNVKKLPKPVSSVKLTQGYIAEDPVVRVRYEGEQTAPTQAWFTFKGDGLLTCSEQEFQVPAVDVQRAATLLHSMGKSGALVKMRHTHIVREADGTERTWVVDQYLAPPKLAGNWIAEVELPSEDVKFEKPVWATKEVTYDAAYKNARLIKNGWPR